MRKLITTAIILIIIITGAYADITFSGDARVRPRLDIVDLGSYGNRTDNVYYFYRARLNVAADIGDGYFFKTKLGITEQQTLQNSEQEPCPQVSVYPALAVQLSALWKSILVTRARPMAGLLESYPFHITHSWICIFTQARWATFPGCCITMLLPQVSTSIICWPVASLT